ncbi:queuine tRNA-ribosyltransferase accessory subunit 2-like isoform X2 [Dysidea avara]|uniref:queuine tRNA-ribosyltransferase accessory subunit 2-like isoform X2 n=1 Tax=Dysidea avara TaxID=196820 RepID=UPI00332700F9
MCGGRSQLFPRYECPGADVMNSFGQGVHKYIGLEDHLVYLTVQDSSKLHSFTYNADKNVSLWTISGRKKVTVEDHVKVLEAFRPDVAQCLCDTIPASNDDVTIKRVRKSVDRTLKFLDETLLAAEKSKSLSSVALLGVIEGTALLEERKRSAKETVKRPVAGYVVEGLTEDVDVSVNKAILTTVMEILPEDKPRFVSGIETPEQILRAVESGVDVFDGVYPYRAAQKGCALVFPTDDKNASHQLDLNDKRYAEEFKPIMDNCKCYSCLHHTRAYIHHLLVTKELLAHTLLMNHNLQHYMSFFADMRKALQTETFHLFKKNFR